VRIWVLEVFSEKADKIGTLTDAFYSKDQAMEWAERHAEAWISVPMNKDEGYSLKVEEFNVSVMHEKHRWIGFQMHQRVRFYKVRTLSLHGSAVDALADRAPGPSIFDRVRMFFA